MRISVQFPDSCTNRDSSFTISNFLRTNENHQRSKRSVNLEDEMPKTEQNENPGNKEGYEEQELEIHEKEEHPIEQSSLQGRVDRLENVVLEIAASLSNIQNEVRETKLPVTNKILVSE